MDRNFQKSYIISAAVFDRMNSCRCKREFQNEKKFRNARNLTAGMFGHFLSDKDAKVPPKMSPKCPKNAPKNAPKSPQKRPQNTPKMPQKCPKNAPQNTPKMHQKCPKNA